jgi:arylsulfatase
VTGRQSRNAAIKRPGLLQNSISLIVTFALSGFGLTATVYAQGQAAGASDQRPNILVIFGDDIGQTNISAYSFGVVGYKTPNIDRVAREGMMFTDYYAENSCTAGRSSFITGQTPKRTGLSKVGIPGAPIGLQARDVTIAQALKPLVHPAGSRDSNRCYELGQ